MRTLHSLLGTLALIVSVGEALPCYESCSADLDNLVTQLATSIQQMSGINDASGLALVIDAVTASDKEKSDFELQRAIATILAAAWHKEGDNFIVGLYRENYASSAFSGFSACDALTFFHNIVSEEGSQSYRDDLATATLKVGAKFRDEFEDEHGILVALPNSPYRRLSDDDISDYLIQDIRVAVSIDDDKVNEQGTLFPQPLDARIVLPIGDDSSMRKEIMDLNQCLIETCDCN